MDTSFSSDLQPYLADFNKIKESVQKIWPLLESLSTLSSLNQDESFWSHIRHDLKTPLNAIRGYTEMVMEDVGDAHPTGSLLAEELKKVLSLSDKISQAMGTITLKNIQSCGEEKKMEEGAEEKKSLLKEEGGEKPFILKAAPKSHPISAHLLVVDDQEDNRDLLQRRLEQEGHKITTAASGLEALELVKKQDFDIILLDLVMPEMNGFEILQTLKGDPQLRHIPVIMISAIDEMEKIAICIEEGAEDYLPKPFNVALLRARIGACLEKKRLYEKEKENDERLAFMAFHDHLTGLANRQEFHAQLEKIVASPSSNNHCALLFCDLDGFKQVNDQFGHEFGDVLLKHVAHKLSQSVRHGDLVARLGGDEFSILVTRFSSREEVEKIIHRIFENVGTSLTHKGQVAQFGLSMGIAFFPQDDRELDALIAKADQAMYEAKRAGKGTYRFFQG
jgi:diguanylate cyclase (GGDEF)-like protein